MLHTEMLHIFQRVTLKNWEEPGDETMRKLCESIKIGLSGYLHFVHLVFQVLHCIV